MQEGRRTLRGGGPADGIDFPWYSACLRVAPGALLLLAAAAGACGESGEPDPADAAADAGADSGVDSDAGPETDAGADAGADAGGEDCAGACAVSAYDECTCSASDPCGFAGNGVCDNACAEIVPEMFDDAADCAADCEPEPWDGVWTYGEDYAAGPYGFQGSMCWQTYGGPCFGIPGAWVDGADHIPDQCFPSALGTEVCPRDWLGSDQYNLIVIEYAAVWCWTCAREVGSEADFIAALAAEGWNALFITLIGEDATHAAPTQDDALNWVDAYGLDPQDVLYDADGAWRESVFADAWPAEQRGFPMNFFVDPSTLLIWDAFSGWANTADEEAWGAWLDCLAGDGVLEQMAASAGGG